MRKLRPFLFVCALAVIFIISCTTFYKKERVNLSLYTPDTSAVFSNSRKSRAVTIQTKDGRIMYKKVYETAEPMPDYVPNDFYLMMSFLGEHVLKCARPVSEEDVEMMEDYEINPDGLKDCFVLYLAEEASAVYKGDEHERLITLKTAADLMREYGREKLHRAYMSAAYMQNDIWGVQSAALSYFGKRIDAVTNQEKIWLMSLMSLGHMPEENRLDFLKRLGLLNSQMTVSGTAGYPVIAKDIEYNREQDVYAYPDFTRLVLEEMEARGISASSEITVTAGIDTRTLQYAEEAVAERLPRMPEGANTVIAVINYKDGTVEAMAVNNRFRYRTMQMQRQIGSTFKPIVYLTAFNNGLRPNQLITDKKYEYKNYGQPYSPDNFEDFYMGTIPLRRGLIFSLNNATIRVARAAGLEKVADTANRLGMEADIKPYLAMPLGIFPIRVINLAQVYSAVANYGMKKDIGFILSVKDANGQELFCGKKGDERIVSEAAAFQTLYIMQEVPRIGTARGTGLIKGTAAKTGTTNDYKDAWIAAVFPPYVAVVWVGYDDNRSMGEKGTGGSLAAPVVAAFQRRIMPYTEKIDLKVPEGVVLKNVDYYSGRPAGAFCPGGRTYTEAFDSANQPAECSVSYAEKIK